jgi:hypothetical protein
LDDFRHLYAHNFAGRLDAAYFTNKKRQVLASDTPQQLTCGAQFNGQQLLLDISHLNSTQQRSETCWSAIEAPFIGTRGPLRGRGPFSALFASMFDDHTIDMVYLMNTEGAVVAT